MNSPRKKARSGLQARRQKLRAVTMRPCHQAVASHASSSNPPERVKLATRTHGLRPRSKLVSAAGTENRQQRARETRETHKRKLKARRHSRATEGQVGTRRHRNDASTGQRVPIQERSRKERYKSTSTRRSNDRFQHAGRHSVTMCRWPCTRRTRTRPGHQECHVSRHVSRKCTKGPTQNTDELSDARPNTQAASAQRDSARYARKAPKNNRKHKR